MDSTTYYHSEQDHGLDTNGNPIPMQSSTPQQQTSQMRPRHHNNNNQNDNGNSNSDGDNSQQIANNGAPEVGGGPLSPSSTSCSSHSSMSSHGAPISDDSERDLNAAHRAMSTSSPSSSYNSSYGSNSGQKLINNSVNSITAEVPGGVVTTQNISTVIRPRVNNNSLQFVKINTPELSKKAVEQIKLAEETKISKNKIKEVEEEWQNNLLNWKSKRRQQFVHSAITSDKDDQSSDRNNTPSDGQGTRKVKTFAEMLEERAKSGTRIGYNLQKYIGSIDDEEELNYDAHSMNHDNVQNNNIDNNDQKNHGQCGENPINDHVDSHQTVLNDKNPKQQHYHEPQLEQVNEHYTKKDNHHDFQKDPMKHCPDLLQNTENRTKHRENKNTDQVGQTTDKMANLAINKPLVSSQESLRETQVKLNPLDSVSKLPDRIALFDDRVKPTERFPMFPRAPDQEDLKSTKLPEENGKLGQMPHLPVRSNISRVHLGRHPQPQKILGEVECTPGLPKEACKSPVTTRDFSLPQTSRPANERISRSGNRDISPGEKNPSFPPSLAISDRLRSPIDRVPQVQHIEPKVDRKQYLTNNNNIGSYAKPNMRNSITDKLSGGHENKGVLSVSGRKRCSSCGEELGRGAAAFVVESLSLYYHTSCFRCSVCHVQLSNGFRGVDVRVHANALHCQNCYSKDGLNYSRV